MRSARWSETPARGGHRDARISTSTKGLVRGAWSEVAVAELAAAAEPEPEPELPPEPVPPEPVPPEPVPPEPVRDGESGAQLNQPVDVLLQNLDGERDFARHGLWLRFMDVTTELSYLGSSARQAGWFGFAACGVTLSACSGAMAVGSHQLYAGAGAPVLPLYLILLTSQIGLVGALGMVAVRHVRLAGDRAGRCEVVWGLVPLLLGSAVTAAEALWAPAPGYLHAQMWLLPLMAHSGAGTCTGLCFEQAALGVWIPLIVYSARTVHACSQRGEGVRKLIPACYVPGTYIDGTVASGAQITAYFAAFFVFAASASVAAWRAERSHRDAFVASLQAQLELEGAKREDGRIAQLVNQGFAAPIIRNMQEVARLSPGPVVQRPTLTSLHLLQSGSVFVVDIVPIASYINASPSALDMCEMLNATFAVVDNAVKAYGCEKVGTIGCRYLAVAGLYSTSTDHAEQAAECCLAIQLAVSHFCGQQRYAQVNGVRVGIHSGDVVFGVLGAGPAPGRLDIFGETVSVAVRMAECAPTGGIVVSRATQSRIQNVFLTERKGVASVKRSRGGVEETFFLKSKHLGKRHQYGHPRLAQTYTRSFSLSSLDVTADVVGACAFPGPVDDQDLPFLHPSIDKVAAALQTSAGQLGDVDGTQLVPGTNRPTQVLSFDNCLRPFSRRGCFGWSFKDQEWEQDFTVNEVTSRRKNQARTLSCILVAFSGGFWMLEKYTASTLSRENITQVDVPGDIDDEDLVFVWGQYVLLCMPICLLLGFMFSKSYKRAPGLLTAIAFIASGTTFAAVIELNHDLPRGQTVAMLWLTAATHAYFGGYMNPAAATITNIANSGLMMATLQSCSMVQPEWMCTHLWTVLLLSIPVHVSGIDAGIAYDRSRRLRYAWWSYYATVAPEFQDTEVWDQGNLSGATASHLSKSGQLLSLLVPTHVASRALAEGSAVTEDYDDAVLAAVDVAGFSQIAQRTGDGDSGRVEALAFVRDAFSVAEILAQKFQVRLLRRAGTSLLVGTGPLSRCQPERASQQHVEGVAEAERLALFGLELIENVRVWGVERWGAQLYHELRAGVRVGISTGRASAGLIGSLRFGYDVWSSGVLLANRLESHAALNTCCTSAEIRAALRRASTAYRFDEQNSRPMMVQGSGSLRTYTLMEYVPAAAEGARLSLSVATPSGVEFGLAHTPARDEDEMMPTTVETPEPVDNMHSDHLGDSETESESQSTDDDQGETMPASYVPVLKTHEQLMPRPVPPSHHPPRGFARSRQQPTPPQPIAPMPPQPLCTTGRTTAGGQAGVGAAQAQAQAHASARPPRRVVI